LYRFAFVLEQTLGHVAHARNIRRALDQHADEIAATLIPVDYRRPAGIRGRLPGLRTWSYEASRQARSELNRHLGQGAYQAIFIHTQVAALLAGGIMKRVPTVLSLDATPSNFDAQGGPYGHRRNGVLSESVKRRINQHVFGRAAVLVTWCRWAAESLVSDYGVRAEKIEVVHPGVDTDLFRPQERAALNEKPIRILFVGGDFERKGGSDLLQAMLRLGPDTHLHVVTTRPVAVPAGISCSVHTGLGPQSPELVSLYRSADIFALPSRGDCFPQAVAEGLACGLPVVATTVGAIPEMVREGVNGHLVPPGEPRALAAALEALVSSSAKRHEMGHWSRVLAEQEHSAITNNRRIFELMARLASTGAALAAAPA